MARLGVTEAAESGYELIGIIPGLGDLSSGCSEGSHCRKACSRLSGATKVQTKRGDSCNQCHVGRFNKAMTTTLLNTTGYVFISSLAQCTRAASVVQQ